MTARLGARLFSPRNRAGFFALVASVLFAGLPSAPCGATTLLSISGANGDTTGTILSLYGDALAISFDLAQARTGLELAVPLTCLNCEARFYLVANEVGPLSNFVLNVRAVTTVSTLAGGGYVNRMTTLFTDLSLDAGTYFLVLAPTRNTVSGVIWTATQSPVVVSAGASHLADLRAAGTAFDVSTPPRSVFSPHLINGAPARLGIAISVPEPAPFAMGLLGLLAMGCRRMRRAR